MNCAAGALEDAGSLARTQHRSRTHEAAAHHRSKLPSVFFMAHFGPAHAIALDFTLRMLQKDYLAYSEEHNLQ
jgi:hypothetical protein